MKRDLSTAYGQSIALTELLVRLYEVSFSANQSALLKEGGPEEWIRGHYTLVAAALDAAGWLSASIEDILEKVS